MVSYDYDRRQASKPMSPWFWKLMDKIAEAHKATIDHAAEEAAGDIFTAESIIKHHPQASDEELAKLALARFDAVPWDKILNQEVSRIIKWVNHNIDQASDAQTEDESYTRVDIEGNKITLRERAWGAMYEYEEGDQFNTRTEIPAHHDMHEDAIERKLKSMGAEARVTWEWKDDPNGYSADVVTFPVVATWYYDEQAMSQKYGGPAFVHHFKAKLPGYRAELAQEMAAEQAMRTHTPAPPPKKRR